VALVNFQHGKLTCLDAAKVTARLEKEFAPDDAVLDRRRRFALSQAFQADGSVKWSTDLGESDKFEVVSLVVAPNGVVAVVRQQQKARAQSQWYVVALNKNNGNLIWRHELRQTPLPDGLMVDRSGQVVVTMVNGNLICFGGTI
jgi:outer membrane protein assembly factor BamB